MTTDEYLDDLIKAHADYHTGNSGLSDKDFKELLLKLIERTTK
jgi:hypothetical protein